MGKTTVLSTIIDSDLKQAVNTVTRKKGIKIRSFVEHALREQLEDYFDIATYQARQEEETVPPAEVAKYLRKLRAR